MNCWGTACAGAYIVGASHVGVDSWTRLLSVVSMWMHLEQVSMWDYDWCQFALAIYVDILHGYNV